jgi:hypothetical protein
MRLAHFFETTLTFCGGKGLLPSRQNQGERLTHHLYATSSRVPFDRGTAADKTNYVSLLSGLRAAFDSSSEKYGGHICISCTSRKDLTRVHRSDGDAPELVWAPPGKHFNKVATAFSLCVP